MRSTRLTLLALGVALASAGPASAASLTTDCAGLQAALDQAQNGDTITLDPITLDQLCTGDDFNLDNGSTRSYTLTGQPGSGAGFDGTGSGTSMVHAIGGAGNITVSNLVFQNAPVAPNRDGGALVFQGDYSVTVDGDTFTGNQVSGSGGAVDVDTSAASAQVAITNDTFRGNQAQSGGGGPAGGGAVNIHTSGASAALALSGDTFSDSQALNGGSGGAVNILNDGAGATTSLSGDTFTHNQTAGGGQGGGMELEAFAVNQSLSVTSSTFSNNVTNSAGGGFEVFAAGSAIPVTMTGNTFSGNQVDGCGSPCELDGGGVSINNAVGGTAPVTQSGNTFTGNSITGGFINVNGGGEAVIGETLNSTGDVFTGNTLQTPAATHASLGSGLGIEHDCSAPAPAQVATNLVAAGNSIADHGTAADARGAVAISCIEGTGTTDSDSLALTNATISGNLGGGGTAGIWGEPQDQLTLQNAILNGDSDGAELTGFSGAGGSVTATYTNLCNGSNPFTGAGNICATPALKDPANGDVHETSASPTIDAGSNSLVPNGLTTDVYGVARIQPKIFGNTPIVDMGAAEFPSIPLPPTASITTPSGGALYSLGQTVNAGYACTEGGGGPGISSCAGPVADGTPIDTSTTGSHTFAVKATSSDGQTGTATVTYTVAAAPSIAIAAPLSGATYIRGNSTVIASYACAEGASGPGLSSCAGSVPSGSQIDTDTPGAHVFTVTARSSDGQTTTASLRYRVVFPSNKPVKPPHLKPHLSGRFIVTVKVPHRGRVDILVTAWKDNFAPHFSPFFTSPFSAASDIGPPKPVLLQPALKRFVFARAHKTFGSGGVQQILVIPNGLGQRLIRHHRYRVTLRLWISYTPWGGHPGKIGYYGLHLPGG